MVYTCNYMFLNKLYMLQLLDRCYLLIGSHIVSLLKNDVLLRELQIGYGYSYSLQYANIEFGHFLLKTIQRKR